MSDITVVEKKRSIIGDLKNLDFPDQVKTKAEDIFQKMTCSIKRSIKRKLLIFYCIYCAYLELEDPHDPFIIARKLSLEKKKASRAFTMFSETQTKYRPPNLEVKPQHYIPQYCTDLFLPDESTQHVVKFANNFLDKNPEMSKETPQKISAGIIYYCLRLYGLNIKIDDLAKYFELSETTIENTHKMISKLDNKD